jgi:hypothetical protein
MNIGYQKGEEENNTILQKLRELIKKEKLEVDTNLVLKIAKISVKIIRLTRAHHDLRRGSSIRGGIDLASLVLTSSVRDKHIDSNEMFWYTGAYMALSSKIEIEDGSDKTIKSVIDYIVSTVLKDF